MNDKIRVILGAMLMVSVIAGISLYLLMDSDISPLEFLAIVVMPLILVLGAAKMLWSRAKSVRSGLPMEDELSKKVNYRAGYYAYMSSIWIALGTMWVSEIFIELEARHVAEIMILIPGLVFIGSYLYMERKGGGSDGL
jgi:hypothetical protein